MRKRSLLGGLPLALLFGCYSDPADLQTNDVIAIELEAQAPLADGVSEVVVQVALSGEAQRGQRITLRSSDGAWLMGTPAGEGAVTLPVPAGLSEVGDKRISTPLRLSRIPGVLYIEAEIVGFVAQTAVHSQPAPPEAIWGHTDVTSLAADGRSMAHLRFDLERSTGTPSEGTRVAFAACCTFEDRPIRCGFRSPLRVPAVAYLGAQSYIEIDAIAEQLTEVELPAGSLAVEVVARVTEGEVSCAAPGPLGVRVPLILTLPE